MRRGFERPAVARAMAGVLLLTGAGLLLQGLWIPAKAALAQVLLERSWRRSQGGVARQSPWPWADTWPVAELRLPRLGVEQIVLAAASGRNLAFGPAHLAGSSLPGTDGNSVLTGHNDTHFAFLERLLVGDRVQVETIDKRVYDYEIVDSFVTSADDPAITEPVGSARLTLVTCYPFRGRAGSGRRLVVLAEPRLR